jgi:hypothetical protein
MFRELFLRLLTKEGEMSRRIVRTQVLGLALAAALAAAPSYAAGGGPSREGAGWRWLASLWGMVVHEAASVWPAPPGTPENGHPEISLGIDPNG